MENPFKKTVLPPEGLLKIASQVPELREHFRNLDKEAENKEWYNSLSPAKRLEHSETRSVLLDTICTFEYQLNQAISEAEKDSDIVMAVRLSKCALKYSEIKGAANACINEYGTDEDGNLLTLKVIGEMYPKPKKAKEYNINTKYGRRKMREESHQAFQELPDSEKNKYYGCMWLVAILIVVFVYTCGKMTGTEKEALRWLRK